MTRRISLSFDNGPTPGVTEHVLDVLAATGVTASFFPVASRIDNDWSREVLSRARTEGHLVGNHSLTHRAPLGDLDPVETIREIAGAQEALGELASPGRLVRPWGTEGELTSRCLNPTAIAHMVRERYTCVLWNSVPRDWDRPVEWVEYALADVERQDETLVVLHDLPTGAMHQLGRFIEELRARKVEITPGFPTSCLPVVDGVVRLELSELVTQAAAEAAAP